MLSLFGYEYYYSTTKKSKGVKKEFKEQTCKTCYWLGIFDQNHCSFHSKKVKPKNRACKSGYKLKSK